MDFVVFLHIPSSSYAADKAVLKKTSRKLKKVADCLWF